MKVEYPDSDVLLYISTHRMTAKVGPTDIDLVDHFLPKASDNAVILSFSSQIDRLAKTGKIYSSASLPRRWNVVGDS